MPATNWRCSGGRRAVRGGNASASPEQVELLGDDLSSSPMRQTKAASTCASSRPEKEVPFAGHPTLGTAYIINQAILQGKVNEVVLNLKVGQIPVHFSPDGYCWMKQIQPVFGPTHEAGILADVLGLNVHDLDERFPVEEVSTGLPFFIVPLKTITALRQAKVDQGKYFELIKNTLAKGILIFCPETHEAGNDLSVRVFVDYYGVPEDPATGSGNGCLAGYLVKQRYFGQERINIRSEQGYGSGRPIAATLEGGRKWGKNRYRGR